jgi:hypothetical protein
MEGNSAANYDWPQQIKKPGFISAFFVPRVREFLITFHFTEVIKLYSLCLLDETRPPRGLVRMAHRISAYPVSRRLGRVDWSQSSMLETE